jgi:hypothetical protein
LHVLTQLLAVLADVLPRVANVDNPFLRFSFSVSSYVPGILVVPVIAVAVPMAIPTVIVIVTPIAVIMMSMAPVMIVRVTTIVTIVLVVPFFVMLFLPTVMLFLPAFVMAAMFPFVVIPVRQGGKCRECQRRANQPG